VAGWCHCLAPWLLACVGSAHAEPGSSPSFDCAKVSGRSVPTLVCNDPALAALDRQLATVYEQAGARAVDERPPTLRAEQRGWIKDRDACWMGADMRGCIERGYKARIAELQARYRLVEARGPLRFACPGDAQNEILVTYFATTPPTLIATLGDAQSVMLFQPAASGSRYEGRNATFWEHQGEATIVWGPAAPKLRCVQVP
jgi:uncharacterized protein